MLAGGAYPAIMPWACCAELRPILSRWKEMTDGKQVLILGPAGRNGPAYELGKLGSAAHPGKPGPGGGRCWSVRKGWGEYREPDKTAYANLDPGQYFMRPSRIPHHHALTLHYCRELNVPSRCIIM